MQAELEHAEKMRKQICTLDSVKESYMAYPKSFAYQSFIGAVQEFEHATSRKKEHSAREMKELVVETLRQSQASLKKFTKQCSERFDELMRALAAEERKVDKAYSSHVATFNEAELAFTKGRSSGKDLWLSEHSFIHSTKAHALR